MATNRYPGTCTTCGNAVPAGEGTLNRVEGAWKVAHAAGTCEQVSLVRIYDFTPAVHNRGVIFHRGKPVVVIRTERMRSQDDEDEWEYIAIARPATEEEIAEHQAEEDARVLFNRSTSAAESVISKGAEVSALPVGAACIGSVARLGFWEPVAFYMDAERVYASYSRYDNDSFGSQIRSLPRSAEVEAGIRFMCTREV